jgi:hypothetical protein
MVRLTHAGDQLITRALAAPTRAVPLAGQRLALPRHSRPRMPRAGPEKGAPRLRSTSGSLAMLAAMRRASSPGEQLGRRAPTGFVLEVEVAERLPVVVADDERLRMLHAQTARAIRLRRRNGARTGKRLAGKLPTLCLASDQPHEPELLRPSMKSAKPEQCHVMWSRGPFVTLNPFSSKASTNRSFPVAVALTVSKAAAMAVPSHTPDGKWLPVTLESPINCDRVRRASAE